VWNYLTPPRVIVTVIWQTDRLKRYQVDSFKEMSLGISRVQETSSGEPTFTRGEIRALTESFIGIEIPDVADDERIETDKKSGDDIEETEQKYILAHGGRTLPQLAASYGYEDVFGLGLRVGTRDLSIMGTIVHWPGTNDWVWIRTDDGYQMLVDGNRLSLVWNVAPEPYVEDWLRAPAIQEGHRVTTRSGTPCTVRFILADTAYVNFDWDAMGISPRPVNIHDLLPLEFEPAGEPLEPVDEVEIDPEEAAATAGETWDQIADEDVKDLI
jgi:hypothetical protein